LTFKETGT